MRALVLITLLGLFKYRISTEIKRFAIEDSSGQADRLDFKTVLDIIARSREQPRSFRRMDDRADKVKFLADFLRKKVKPGKLKNILRQDAAPNVARMDFEVLIENELKNALALKSSALNDRPVVQKSGKNDFLVMKPDILDPFVTVVPNNIYYNIEKKCVNWLDDCNLHGIRARLLRKVKSPFK